MLAGPKRKKIIPWAVRDVNVGKAPPFLTTHYTGVGYMFTYWSFKAYWCDQTKVARQRWPGGRSQTDGTILRSLDWGCQNEKNIGGQAEARLKGPDWVSHVWFPLNRQCPLLVCLCQHNFYQDKSQGTGFRSRYHNSCVLVCLLACPSPLKRLQILLFIKW